MAKQEALDTVEAHRLIEEEHDLPRGSVGELLKWLPVVQAIAATARAIKNQAIGERVEIPAVRGIRIGSREEDFDGAGFTRRK
jgi:hypothetical protein